MHSTEEVRRALIQRREAGSSGSTRARLLASGAGWTAKDIVCTHDRHDRAFEEQHNAVSVSMVLAGTFQYHCQDSTALLAPGALMLGNHGTCFVCSHEHGAGDRCIAFHFTPEYFERIAADAGFRRMTFPTTRVPPLRALGRVGALVGARLLHDDAPWDDIALDLAARALALAHNETLRMRAPARAMIGRITDALRAIEDNPGADHSIQNLAHAAGVGPYYFLRAFEQVTGVTPHQFVVRARLRRAADRLVSDDAPVARIAFESGFGDLSNFNHSFRAEFGVTPRQWRMAK
jgi:AraC-like DNA-binding protein